MCGLQHVLLSLFLFTVVPIGVRTLVLTLTRYVGDTITYYDFYEKDQRTESWLLYSIYTYICYYLLRLCLK